LLRKYGVSTVCEEARCPNRAECFSKPTAAFMILGSTCTRSCGFCAVKSSCPEPVDENEPENVALAAQEMGLKYVVVTSVTRDDLPDGGAEQFSKTINALKKRLPYAKIEVLTPDFNGDMKAHEKVLKARPAIYNHNVETVERLYPEVRPEADYRRSLNILEYAKRTAPDIYTKSGLMLGLGETINDIMYLLTDLRNVKCDIITIGQYLRPTKKNLPVVEYIQPDVFDDLRIKALEIGFKYVASGPLVRSSMNAEEMYEYV
jgi:lipoic acid synthetase